MIYFFFFNKSLVVCESVGGKVDLLNVFCCLIDSFIFNMVFVGIVVMLVDVKVFFKIFCWLCFVLLYCFLLKIIISLIFVMLLWNVINWFFLFCSFNYLVFWRKLWFCLRLSGYSLLNLVCCFGIEKYFVFSFLVVVVWMY